MHGPGLLALGLALLLAACASVPPHTPPHTASDKPAEAAPAAPPPWQDLAPGLQLRRWSYGVIVNTLTRRILHALQPLRDLLCHALFLMFFTAICVNAGSQSTVNVLRRRNI